MIRYALSSLDLISRLLWSSRVWFAEHKWWRRIFTVLAIDLVLMVFGNVAAHAADGGSGIVAPFLPGGSIHDSSGIPLANYIVLPLDRGGVFDFGKAIVTAPLDFIWTGHLGAFAWMIWLCDWVISFEWLQLLTVPFNTLAELLQEALGRLNWIPFALAVTAGIAGLAILSGKKVMSGWTEMLVSAFLAFLAVGMLANPVATLTGAGGALDTARDWGNNLAAAVATDDLDTVDFNTEDVLSETVSMQLVDVFVKIPAQALTFGHALEGECAAKFDETMLTKAPVISNGNDVRDAVSGCDPAAKNFVEHPNFGQVISALMIAPGGMVILGFPIALMVLFFSSAFKTLIDALKTMWNVYWGILPVNRHALWSSLGGMFLGAATIAFLIVLMAASLRLIVAFLTGINGMGIPIVAVMQIANIFLIVLIVMLVIAKKRAKKAGQTLAEHLSRLGLSSGSSGSQRDGTKALAIMSMGATVAAAALRRPDNATRIDARSINGFGMSGQGSTPTPPMNMTATPVTPTPPPSGGPAPTALPSGRPSGGSGGGAPLAIAGGSGPSGKVGKTADVAFTATRIAKGAAGGVPGVVGAAALEVGSRVASKAGGRVMRSLPAPAPHPMSQPAQPATFVVEPRRIVVDESGQGHIVRPAPMFDGVPDVTSLPPDPARSARSEAFRARLADARAA